MDLPSASEVPHTPFCRCTHERADHSKKGYGACKYCDCKRFMFRTGGGKRKARHPGLRKQQSEITRKG